MHKLKSHLGKDCWNMIVLAHFEISSKLDRSTRIKKTEKFKGVLELLFNKPQKIEGIFTMKEVDLRFPKTSNTLRKTKWWLLHD